MNVFEEVWNQLEQEAVLAWKNTHFQQVVVVVYIYFALMNKYIVFNKQKIKNNIQGKKSTHKNK